MRPHHTRTATIVAAIALLCAAVLFVEEFGPTGHVVDTFGVSVLVTDGSESLPSAPAESDSSGRSSHTPRLGPWEFTSAAPLESSATDPQTVDVPSAEELRFELTSQEIAIPPLEPGARIDVPFTITNLAPEPITLTLTSIDAFVQVPPPITIAPGETATALIQVTVDWVGKRDLIVDVADGRSTRQALLSIDVPTPALAGILVEPIAIPIEEAAAPIRLPSWSTNAFLLVGVVALGTLLAFHYGKPRAPVVAALKGPDPFAPSAPETLPAQEPSGAVPTVQQPLAQEPVAAKPVVEQASAQDLPTSESAGQVQPEEPPKT